MKNKPKLIVRWQRPVFPPYQETILDLELEAPTTLNLTEIEQ